MWEPPRGASWVSLLRWRISTLNMLWHVLRSLLWAMGCLSPCIEADECPFCASCFSSCQWVFQLVSDENVQILFMRRLGLKSEVELSSFFILFLELWSASGSWFWVYVDIFATVLVWSCGCVCVKEGRRCRAVGRRGMPVGLGVNYAYLYAYSYGNLVHSYY